MAVPGAGALRDRLAAGSDRRPGKSAESRGRVHPQGVRTARQNGWKSFFQPLARVPAYLLVTITSIT